MENQKKENFPSKQKEITVWLAKKDCKRCHGRGYTGFRVLEQHLEPCKCLKALENNDNVFTELSKEEYLKYKVLTLQEVKDELNKWQRITAEQGRKKGARSKPS